MKRKLMMKLLLLAGCLSGFAPVAQAFYNPDTGRWLSRDPIEEMDGPNQHAFLHNGPVNKVDLDGRTGWQLPPQLNQDREFTEGYWRGAGDAALPCLVVITLLTPVPGDEAIIGAVVTARIGKALNKCGKCKDIRCVVRWHTKHHPFNGVKKCHLEFQCYIKGQPGKPSKIHVPLPDWLCPSKNLQFP
jgi:hypothetical protein